MNITREEHGAVEVIGLPQRLTMSDAGEYRHAIRDIVDSGCKLIALDMSRVDFVDSSGLSVLVSAYKAARNADGDAALFGLQPQVRALVELTRLHHIFEVFADKTSAVNHLNQSTVA
jgi:anti-sigma B factor antagonist